ncbi:MAG: hypothetical protein KAI57_00965 [Candidatus Pacebacteria bacterium]|nr:hypothetical protein [Candidatus Paceibacterota bacterium]
MITKTYLDGKLNQLEENLKRRIETKDNFQTEEINKKISDLKDSVNLISERAIENKDILNNYLVEHNGLKEEVQKLKHKIESIEEHKKDNSSVKLENDDIITSDI